MQSQPVSNQSISDSHEIRDFFLIETLCFTKLLKNIDSFERVCDSITSHSICHLKKFVFTNSLKSQILGGAERNRTDDILLAKQTLYQLSYGPVCFAWWVRKDSNLRPPPYQDGALTD